MLETLLPVSTKNLRRGIDINWSDIEVGSKVVSDKCGNVWTVAGDGSGSGVVLDSVKGNVFQALGNIYFTTPITELLYLSKKSFVIEYEVLPKTNGSHNLGATGDYNQGISSGVGLNMGQFSERYFQAFLMGPGTSYDRLFAYVQYSPVWTRVVITRTYGKGFRMDVYRDGSLIASATASEIEIGNGSGKWYLFKGSNTPSNFFYGLINYFKLSYF